MMTSGSFLWEIVCCLLKRVLKIRFLLIVDNAFEYRTYILKRSSFHTLKNFLLTGCTCHRLLFQTDFFCQISSDLRVKHMLRRIFKCSQLKSILRCKITLSVLNQANPVRISMIKYVSLHSQHRCGWFLIRCQWNDLICNN